MPKLISYIIIVSALLHGNQAIAQDTIYWKKSYQLIWNDFKAVPISGTYFQALTSAGIVYTVAYRDHITRFDVRAFFVRPKSWRKPNAGDTILKHEQGHFDITEIYARRLRTALENFKAGSKPLQAAVNEMADKIIQEKNAFQKQYDEETNFGTNHGEQLCWDGWIASLLN